MWEYFIENKSKIRTFWSSNTAWKVFKYWVFSGSNTGKYGPDLLVLKKIVKYVDV